MAGPWSGSAEHGLQNGRRACRVAARRSRRLYRRRARFRRHDPPGLSQRRPLDFQSRPENLERMTFAPIGAYPGGRRRINRCWQRPRNLEELVQRRQALVAWAEQSGGFVGRSPDHVASSLLGQVIGIEVFRRHGEARAKALLDYFDHASRNDLFLSYVIINPQADLSKAWGQQDDELVAQLVDEDAAASRCAAQKCSAPAPSWPTRSWSPIFSR